MVAPRADVVQGALPRVLAGSGVPEDRPAAAPAEAVGLRYGEGRVRDRWAAAEVRRAPWNALKMLFFRPHDEARPGCAA
jgi:hypothetical protein